MTDAEIKQLAIDMRAGKVFTNLNLHDQEDVLLVFPALILLSDEQRQEIIDRKVELIYEYVDKAGPMSINGYPSFFSYRFLSSEETDKLFDMIKRLHDAEGAVV